MNKQTWNYLATARAGEHIELDKYINLELIQELVGKGVHSHAEELDESLGDYRFFTAAGKVRKLLGASAKVEKQIVRGKKVDVILKQMFLCPEKEMYIDAEKVFPKEGWLPSSTAKEKFRGIPHSVAPAGWVTPSIMFKQSSTSKYPSNCKFAGKCKNTCLKGTGNLTLPSSLRSRYAKSWFFKTRPLAFMRLLIHEIIIESLKAASNGKLLYLRLNGMSDIRWERYLNMDKLVEKFSGLGGFYDYTKYPKSSRWYEGWPKSYRIVFSIDEKPLSWQWAEEWMKDGHSSSAVYHAPKKRKPQALIDAIASHAHVVDGDLDDGRFADLPSSLVLLRNKGTLKAETHLGLTKQGIQSDLMCPTELLLKKCETLGRMIWTVS